MVESIVGPWAKDKLDRLGEYLNAYTTIMRKQPWCKGFVYVDAFAGPGQHRIRQKNAGPSVQRDLLEVATYSYEDEEQCNFVAGSPRVALEIKFPFDWYVFVESNTERVSNLEKLREEYRGRRTIVIRQKDCNEYLLEKLVSNPKIDWSTWRAVVFLDPFGMHVP